jgi:spore cortex biosynthesis protein YabQ
MMLSVSEQVIVFLSTALCGMVIALVYDMFRILRKAVRTGSIMTFVQDILYWIIASVIMFVTIYCSNDGELRGFLFLGALLGVILYAFAFSRAIMNSSLFIIKIVTRGIRFISLLISYPFRITVKLLVMPALKFIGGAVKYVWEVCTAAKANLTEHGNTSERDSAAPNFFRKAIGRFGKKLQKAGSGKDLMQ